MGAWGEPAEKGDKGDTGGTGSTGASGVNGFDINRNDIIGVDAHLLGGIPWNTWTTIWTFPHTAGHSLTLGGFVHVAAMDGVDQLGTFSASFVGSAIRPGIPAPVLDGVPSFLESGSLRLGAFRLEPVGNDLALQFFHKIPPLPGGAPINDGRIRLALNAFSAGPT